MLKNTDPSKPDERTIHRSKSTTYVVDQLEEKHSVILKDKKGDRFNIPRFWLPDGLDEGDVVVVKQQMFLGEDAADIATRYRGLDMYVGKNVTEARLALAIHLRASLPKGPEGDLSL